MSAIQNGERVGTIKNFEKAKEAGVGKHWCQ